MTRARIPSMTRRGLRPRGRVLRAILDYGPASSLTCGALSVSSLSDGTPRLGSRDSDSGAAPRGGGACACRTCVLRERRWTRDSELRTVLVDGTENALQGPDWNRNTPDQLKDPSESFRPNRPKEGHAERGPC